MIKIFSCTLIMKESKISFGVGYESNIQKEAFRSLENRAAFITVLRAIAQLWEQYQSVELTFDGNVLIIKHIDVGQAAYDSIEIMVSR